MRDVHRRLRRVVPCRRAAGRYTEVLSSSVEEIQGSAVRGGYAPLPVAAQRLLEVMDPSARLIAHLILVHDAAHRLLDGFEFSGLERGQVLFGAAIHDIGKGLIPAELSAPGSSHEGAGERWLIEQGVSPNHARFARTHGLKVEDPSLEAEDLWVIAADKLWKGRRLHALEERIVAAMARAEGMDFWDAWTLLGARFDRVAADADRRLAWQACYPAERHG